jgi:SNF2 family DNA or RNA helicase
MKPIVEKVGDRIHLRSEFADKDVAKSVIGARWSKASRVWTYPLDMETCRRLRDAFGQRLQIGPELWTWSKAQGQKEVGLEALIDVSKIDFTKVVDLEVVPKAAPTMWRAMQQRPYQPLAVKYMAGAGSCLNADQPGIGKTIETLGALIEGEVTGPVLILAPKTSCQVVWEAEIPKWYADDVPYTITQMAGKNPKQRAAAQAQFEGYVKSNPNMLHFVIANAEQAGIKRDTQCPDDICNGDEDWCPSFDKHKNRSTVRRPFLHAVQWSAIIADETHKWLINTKGKSASQVGYGFTRLRIKEGGRKYALSGTPLKGKKWNLFGTLNWLWPRTYTSKWRWIETYFTVEKEEKDFGRVKGIVEVRTITGKFKSKREQEAFFRSLKTVMIRRTKDELRAINPAWMPPEKRYHDVYVDMDKTQRTHYNAMEKEQRVLLGEQRLTATGILAELTRLRQFATCDWTMTEDGLRPVFPSGKFNWLTEFLSERGIDRDGELSDDVRKVVVASQWTSVINLMAAELVGMGIQCHVLTGETKDKDRSARVNDFQTNPGVRVFFINMTAGGVSITLDAADDIVLLDETWVPDEAEQVEDRVHRASNVTHQVDVWYVRSRGSIEEQIAQLNAGKAESNHVVLDAQRGLRFASERFGATKIKEKA